ncbi:BnaA09g53650D [Brassica napus]|uniref:BnaA09g53650D protein n=1 Tax=Brassica napus TaxID=3708 RepID=A0A078J432_BRANA|nr:BnaA09g53650D [Brassica napus]
MRDERKIFVFKLGFCLKLGFVRDTKLLSNVCDDTDLHSSRSPDQYTLKTTCEIFIEIPENHHLNIASSSPPPRLLIAFEDFYGAKLLVVSIPNPNVVLSSSSSSYKDLSLVNIKGKIVYNAGRGLICVGAVLALDDLPWRLEHKIVVLGGEETWRESPCDIDSPHNSIIVRFDVSGEVCLVSKEWSDPFCLFYYKLEKRSMRSVAIEGLPISDFKKIQALSVTSVSDHYESLLSL